MAKHKDTDESKGTNICGFRKKDGGMCSYPAGTGTEHKGSGPCYRHDFERRERSIGDARILTIVARNPELAERAQVYLNSDRELLNARRELAVLKARFETMHLNQSDDADVPKLCQLANTISLMTRRIQDIEIARKHYIHIDVLTRFTADFSRIGQEFFPDVSIREQFLDALESSIKDTIPRSNARGIAARLMTKDAGNVVVDVTDYEVADGAVKEEEVGEEIEEEKEKKDVSRAAN